MQIQVLHRPRSPVNSLFQFLLYHYVAIEKYNSLEFIGFERVDRNEGFRNFCKSLRLRDLKNLIEESEGLHI
ncbi:MAG: hypothetical protein HYS83_02515 [Candidatus Blackburnbacteria bacterium]|nr:hypothetical protein [Candidatus Blackburnbacteria bacterium]